jgi:hypothetical protein
MPGLNARQTRMAAHALALAIVVLAALLRLDAFVGKYGTLDHPAWARITTHQIAPLASRLRPSGVRWSRERAPYVGGDPINYLAYAREMESFYQPHVREPVFLALTRLALWSLDGQDAAVSLASAAGSVLAVLATYLLGAALLSPGAGLLASLLLAIEYEAILWAPDGWRDDTFTATVLFAAWALLRLHQRPSVRRALLTGALCGVACLTRITALIFVMPAFVWLVAAAVPGQRREQVRCVAVALLISTVLVAPYLVSCAIATGDPLFSLNYHTIYYRHAEGMNISEPMSAAGYLRTKFASRPVATFDTGFIGLFVQPFATKWNGLDQWIPGLGIAARWTALVGLALLPFTRSGKLLLVILFTSTLPYAFTWNVGGGDQWRFTMHAYPFYMVAAAFAVVGAIGMLIDAAQRFAPISREVFARIGRRTAAVVMAALVGTVLYFGLPWLVVNEAIAAGESTSIETGPRDLAFYRAGWSVPHSDGIIVRLSTAQRSAIHIPLPARRQYDLVLRLDPVAPEAQQHVSVLFNRRLVGLLRLTWDPQRVGAYRLRLPADAVRAGSNELVIVPEPTMAAGAAGPRFAWLEPDEQIGVRLWYVRVLP